MRPCSLFMLLAENDKKICKNGSKFNFGLEAKERDYCPYYLDCCKLTKQPYKVTKKTNVTIRTFKDVLQEVVFYDKPFEVTVEAGNLEAPERKFIKVGEYLIPVKDGVGLMDMYESSSDAANRAFNKIIDFSMSNEWSHFLTLTFDKKIVGNRYDDEKIKECWRIFRQFAQRKDPNIKLLAIPERHKDGALHFHVLVHTTYGFVVTPYIENGEVQYSKNGDMLFELLEWKFGLATAVIFPVENIEGNNVRVSYYLTKYITKQDAQGYNKKRYFRTHNLLDAKHECCLMSDSDIDTEMAKAGMKLVKIINGGKVFRNY